MANNINTSLCQSISQFNDVKVIATDVRLLLANLNFLVEVYFNLTSKYYQEVTQGLSLSLR